MRHGIKNFLKNEKNRAIFIAIVIFAALFVYAGAHDASGGFFGDLWRGFLAPFGPTTGTAPQAQPQAPLYKPVLDYEHAVIEAAKKVSPAVVSITISKNVPVIENCPYSPFGDVPPEFRQFFGDLPQFSVPCSTGKTELQEVGGGSGFIISADGLILTNKHVVADEKASYTVFTNSGKKYDAKVLARSPSQDLAVIKIDAGGLPTVELGDSGELELGQTAIAIGNALGEFRNTVSVGVISGLSRTVTAAGPGVGAETIQGVVQTDAAINPGNSGGPLLNLRGEVVGINTAVAQGAQNIGFAIPINDAKRAIDSVKRTGEIESAYLGVRYFLITPEFAKKQKLPVDYGAIVRGSADGPGVIPGTPAERAGLLAEDIILEVNGKKIGADNSLGAAIAGFGVGETVSLKILRGSDELTVRVVLGKRPAE